MKLTLPPTRPPARPPARLQAIITTKFMLVVNPEEDSSVKFIGVLKERLASPGHGMGKSVQSMGDLQKAGTSGLMADMDLPFELRALEICLDEVGVQKYSTLGI